MKEPILESSFFVPPELLVDIFKFLDRNSIEKSQIVYKLLESSNTLPLRLLKSSKIMNQGENIVFYAPNDKYPIFLPKKNYNLSLKNCILEYVWFHRPFDDTDSIIGDQLKDFDMEILLKNFEKLTNSTDEKIRVQRFEYATGDVEKDEILMKNLEKLLIHQLNVQELNLHLTEKCLKDVVKNLQIFDLNSANLPKTIKLACLSNNYIDIMRDFRNNYAEFFTLTVENLASFMKFSQKLSCEVILASMPASRNFCQDYIQLFQKIQTPESMIKKIEIELSPTNHVLTLEFLNDFSSAEKLLVQQKYGSEIVYKIRRNDGWALEIMSSSFRGLTFAIKQE